MAPGLTRQSIDRGRDSCDCHLPAVALIALLIVAAGAWASWGTAQHAMLTKGRERGTLTEQLWAH